VKYFEGSRRLVIVLLVLLSSPTVRLYTDSSISSESSGAEPRNPSGKTEPRDSADIIKSLTVDQQNQNKSPEKNRRITYEDEIEKLPDFVIDSEEGFNIKEKQEQVKFLVQKGVDYLKDHTFDDAFNAFSHSFEFRLGELYIFVYSNDGTVLAHGGFSDMLWKNQWDEQDIYGVYLVREIVDGAKSAGETGAWVNYNWKGASKRSFVRLVEKGDRTYIIGSGYYPHSKADAVINLVQGATEYFHEIVHKQGKTVNDAFSTFSYPLGTFVQGDLYLYALSFDGTVMAQGDRPGLIGTNVWDFQDSDGVYVNREIVNKLKEGTGSVWQRYNSKNAPKIAYAKEVVDKEEKRYFIACGYYPDANRNEVVELVKRGYQFFKRHGREAAVKEFSDKRNNRFRYGDLSLVVHDDKGVIVADGGNPDLIGVQGWDFKDQDGKYVVREMIERAKAGGGWISFKLKNAYKLAYVEEVDIGTEHYVVSSGLYPISKEESMWLMVKSAVSLFVAEPLEKSLREFVSRYSVVSDSGYLLGDLWIYVLDTSGIVLAWGPYADNIWKNFINEKDDFGKPYIRMLINAVRQGPATVTYQLNNVKRFAYAEEVTKNGRTYVIGSGYYK
jgi:cytochrome c